MLEQFDEVDFALVAFRVNGAWTVEELAHDQLVDVETMAVALRRFSGDSGVVGLVALDEDYFVVVRVVGTSTRVLLSDTGAADDWDLADSVLEVLGLPTPGADDDGVPAGDLGLLADLGMHEMDLGILLEDVDLYADEVLSDISIRLGFGDLFDDAVGVVSA